MTRFTRSLGCGVAARPPLPALLCAFCLVITGGYLYSIPSMNGRLALRAILSMISAHESSWATSGYGSVSRIRNPARRCCASVWRLIVVFWCSMKLTCFLTLGLILIRSTTSFRMAATTVSVSSRSPAVRRTCRADSRLNRLSTTRTYGSRKTARGSRPDSDMNPLRLALMNGACTVLMDRRN